MKRHVSAVGKATDEVNSRSRQLKINELNQNSEETLQAETVYVRR